MAAFEGTILAIVHDRYFVEGFASGIWALEEGRIHTYQDLPGVRKGGQRAPSRQESGT